MGNRNIPFGLVDVDGLLAEDGVLGIYEGKCPQVFATQKPWLQIKRRGNGPDCAELIPMDYFLQVQWAMLITGLPFAYICAGGWGMRQDDIAYVRIEKLPPDGQEALLEGVRLFVRNTARGIRPSDVDYQDKKRLLEEYSKMYLCKELSEKPVTLPSCASALIETIRSAEEKKKEIKRAVKALEEELDLKEIERSAAAAKAALAEMMYTSKHAVATDASGKQVLVSYEFGRGSFDKDLCEKKYPEVFREVYRPKTRSIGWAMSGFLQTEARGPTPTPVSLRRPSNAPAAVRNSTILRVCRSLRSYSAAAAQNVRRWFTRALIGSTVYLSVQLWLRRPQQPLRVQSV